MDNRVNEWLAVVVTITFLPMISLMRINFIEELHDKWKRWM